MYLRRVVLENVRGFEQLDFRFGHGKDRLLGTLSETVSESVAEITNKLDLQPFLEAANTWTFGVSGFVGKLVLPEVVDGAANALLIRRLGRRTIEILSPTAVR